MLKGKNMKSFNLRKLRTAKSSCYAVAKMANRQVTTLVTRRLIARRAAGGEWLPKSIDKSQLVETWKTQMAPQRCYQQWYPNHEERECYVGRGCWIKRMPPCNEGDRATVEVEIPGLKGRLLPAGLDKEKDLEKPIPLHVRAGIMKRGTGCKHPLVEKVMLGDKDAIEHTNGLKQLSKVNRGVTSLNVLIPFPGMILRGNASFRGTAATRVPKRARRRVGMSRRKLLAWKRARAVSGRGGCREASSLFDRSSL
jgi:hypothetical protein